MVQASSSGPRDRRRGAFIGGLIVVVALIGIGAFALVPRSSPPTQGSGPRLSISIVDPVEPERVPGDILDVGALNDAFDRASLDQQAEIVPTGDLPPDAYAGEDWPPLEPVVDKGPMTQPAATMTATVTTTDPLADGSRLFGFDRRPARAPIDPSSSENATIQSEPGKASDTFFE